MAPGFAGDFRHPYLIKLLAARGHFGNKAFLHQAAFLAACVSVKLIVKTNSGKFFLPEPGLHSHVKTDVHSRAIARKDNNILDFIREPRDEASLET